MTDVSMTTEQLRLEAVTKTYGRQATASNASITLTLRPGELTALVGHNGAGKTTLLNQVIGTTKPTSGDILYGATSLVSHPDIARRAASMMPQMHAPLTGVTPRQAITSIGRLRGLSRPDWRGATDQLIKQLDIERWQNVGGEKLSGGLRRLTSFAMAVVAPPPILLLDEPTNDVDPVRRAKVWQHLRRLADDGHIVIVVTHNLLEVQRTADRYVLMQNGEVVVDSTPRLLARQAGTTTLSIFVCPGTTLASTPPAIQVHHAADDGGMRLDLEPHQVQDAVAWVLDRVEAGEVNSYSLAPASLESIYEGATNDR